MTRVVNIVNEGGGRRETKAQKTRFQLRESSGDSLSGAASTSCTSGEIVTGRRVYCLCGSGKFKTGEVLSSFHHEVNHNIPSFELGRCILLGE
jgi:hypothetical protein